jgi:NADH dehydrogenase
MDSALNVTDSALNVTDSALNAMDAARNAPEAHRVVIIGGGFGGLRAAKALAGGPAQVTLIDQTNHHLFQPLLYQVATGVLSPGQIAPALRSLFRHEDNVEVVLGMVHDLDLEQRTVKLLAEDEVEIPYDSLVVAAGATHSYFGHEEWIGVAPGMKTLDDAIRLRSRILSAFEFAEQAQTSEERDAWLTFAIVGAGPTGVELAGQIAVVAHKVLRGEYRHIDPATTRVILLDAAPSVPGDFAPTLGKRAARDLARLGVDVALDSPVVGVDHEGVTVGADGESRNIRAKTVLWAAGVKASPLAELLARLSGAQLDRAGRLRIESTLTLPGHPEVFAIGDMVSLPGVPGMAQPAIQQGKYVARVISNRLAGEADSKPFKYRNLGMLAVTGRVDAVADLFGRIRLGGPPAFLIWAVIHLAYLVGWGNRFGAVTRWLWTVLARNRRERLISMTSLVDARTGEAAFAQAPSERGGEETAGGVPGGRAGEAAAGGVPGARSAVPRQDSSPAQRDG